MARPPIHIVESPRHWKVMIAPVRLEVIEAMRMIAPCSIAEIAVALDRSADTLYRHIEKLRTAGAVVVAVALRRLKTLNARPSFARSALSASAVPI